MNADQQIEMFQVQSCWLEREYHAAIFARTIDWEKLREIRQRTNQLNREFNEFWERTT